MHRNQKLSVLLMTSASMLWAWPALAQAQQAQDASSQVYLPASQTTNAGTVNVQGAGEALGSGYIIPEDGPKDRSTVTAQGIQNMAPTANPFQMIAILPGVNTFEDDPSGLYGGTIRVRGLVASQMGFTINGAPFNDSGTFNVYPNEIIDSENVAQMWVTQGSTDIDAPHVGASGGNIGVVTRAPMDDFNVKLEESGGSQNLTREFVSIDTGLIGNFKAFGSFSYTNEGKWRGFGAANRRHTDGNMSWQFAPESSIGLTWTYNDAVTDYYRDYASSGIYNVYTTGKTPLQTFQAIGSKADYDTFWGSSAAYPVNLYGKSSTGACATNPNPNCTVANPQFPTIDGGGNNTNVTNAYGLNLNPYRDGVVTVPVHIQLTDHLKWDTNAYVWWGQGGADFGGTVTEGSYSNGYDVLPQYGNTAGSTNAILVSEETTNSTFRPGFTTKFTYDMDNFTFMGGAWYEHSHLRYDEPLSLVNANATPCDLWLTSTTNNACAVTGTSMGTTGPVYLTNYLADSVGESVFGEAQGRFLNDALKVSVGLADRAIIRQVHNYDPICADTPGLAAEPGSTLSCASFAASTAFLESSAYNYFNGPKVGAAAAYSAMQQFAANPRLKYQALLPEFNASYDIDPSQQIFAGLSTGFRSPSVTNFAQFTSGNTATSSNIMKIVDVKSEYAYSYEAGYRYHDDFWVASATAYLQNVQNYQATVQIDPADFITDNIGGVQIYGIDFEAGTKPWHGFTFYGSAEIQNSRLDDNLAADYSGSYPNDTIQYVNTKGKQLVDTPNWLVSANIGYAEDGYFASLTPHCYGQRATALLNDEFIPANCIVDASVGYKFGAIAGVAKDATFQIYASNLFNTGYLGEVYTQGQTNAKTAQAYSANGTALTGSAATVFGQTYSAEPGAPFFIGAKLTVDVGN